MLPAVQHQNILLGKLHTNKPANKSCSSFPKAKTQTACWLAFTAEPEEGFLLQTRHSKKLKNQQKTNARLQEELLKERTDRKTRIHLLVWFWSNGLFSIPFQENKHQGAWMSCYRFTPWASEPLSSSLYFTLSSQSALCCDKLSYGPTWQFRGILKHFKSLQLKKNKKSLILCLLSLSSTWPLTSFIS